MQVFRNIIDPRAKREFRVYLKDAGVGQFLPFFGDLTGHEVLDGVSQGSLESYRQMVTLCPNLSFYSGETKEVKNPSQAAEAWQEWFGEVAKHTNLERRVLGAIAKKDENNAGKWEELIFPKYEVEIIEDEEGKFEGPVITDASYQRLQELGKELDVDLYHKTRRQVRKEYALGLMQEMRVPGTEVSFYDALFLEPTRYFKTLVALHDGLKIGTGAQQQETQSENQPKLALVYDP